MCLDFPSSNPQNSRYESPTGFTKSGKKPDKTLSAGSFLFSVNAAHNLILKEANHIQAHAKEQVQSRCAGRAAAPTVPSSQLLQPEQVASTTYLVFLEWWKGLHCKSRCRWDIFLASSRMLTEGAGFFSTRGQKYKPCLQAQPLLQSS